MRTSRHLALSPAALLFALLGACGAAALWVILAFLLARPTSWFAFFAAADLALMLRLARAKPGPARACLAALGTAVAIVLAQWWLMAAQVGQQIGFLPWESIAKMGAGFAWTLSLFWLQPLDYLLYAAAVALAALLSR